MSASANYLRSDNLCFVPVLRHQLSFAVLMRRAFLELAHERPWTGEDLVAVALPPSIGRESEKLLREWRGECLPVTLLYASWGPDEPREAFAVSPADAVTEALRLALEHHVPLAYIDREIAPKHLMLRRCSSDPLWPDPALALEESIGCSGYIEMIRQLCREPPVRFEPVDTWREEHLAARLRELHANYRRILVVCEAQHYLALPTLLASMGAYTQGRVPEASPTAVYESGGPTIETLLHYLDEFPKLTEAFQRSRSNAQASFDPYRELLSLVARLSYGDESSKPSARRSEVFVRYLQAISRATRRVLPRAGELHEVCRGCLGEDIASKVIHRLGEYEDQITLERITVKKHARTASYSVKPHPGKQGIVARACGGGSSGYVPEPRPPRSGARRKSSSHWIDRSICKTLRLKAAFLAESHDRERRTREFRGSIEGGIDVRRTMRAAQDVIPKIYVKAGMPRKARSDYKHEPIVWILRVEDEDLWLPPQLRCVVTEYHEISVPEKSRALGHEEEAFTAEDDSFTLTTTKVYGFLDLEGLWSESLPKEQMEKHLRCWEHGKRFDPGSRLGCVVRELASEEAESEWLTVLMQTAVIAARGATIFVLPHSVRVPGAVRSLASLRNKRIITLDLASFSADERAKLGEGVRVKIHKDEEKVRGRVFAAVEKLGLG